MSQPARRGIGEPGREQRGLDAPVSVGGRGRGAGELRDTFGQVELAPRP